VVPFDKYSEKAASAQIASADEISVVFIPPAPAPLVAPRNIVPAGDKEF
jgi:hypothetical protein